MSDFAFPSTPQAYIDSNFPQAGTVLAPSRIADAREKLRAKGMAPADVGVVPPLK